MNRLSTGARRSTRLAAAVLAIVCVTAVVAGTGLGKTARATAPRSSQVSGTITLAHWASSTVETQLLRQVLTAFKKKYPKIKVNELGARPVSDPDAGSVRGEEVSGRLLRRLERVPRLAASEAAGAAERVRHAEPLQHPKPFFRAPPERISSRGRRSTASRRTGRRSRWRSTPTLAGEGGREAAEGEDVGATYERSPLRKLKDTNAVPGGRTAVRRSGTGFAPAGVRLPEQGLVPEREEDGADREDGGGASGQGPVLLRVPVNPGLAATTRQSSAWAGAVRHWARRRPQSRSRATGSSATCPTTFPGVKV